MISPEFETEFAKKVLGQWADLSRHGAADRQLANEICFIIDNKMLPYFLYADLSSGCTILRVFHKLILASTAEHTAALHEVFAKPIPCRDKMKVLLTLRQWLTDLKELQAAGSSPFKETVIQSLKTVRVESGTLAMCTKSLICRRRTIQESCALPFKRNAAG